MTGATYDYWSAGMPAIAENQWYVLAQTYSNGVTAQSINGVITSLSYGTDTASGALNDNNQPVYIGRRAAGYSDFTMEWLIAYNRSLSASEIALLYREPFCMFERKISPAYFLIAASSSSSLSSSSESSSS